MVFLTYGAGSEHMLCVLALRSTSLHMEGLDPPCCIPSYTITMILGAFGSATADQGLDGVPYAV
jgi:hypothetical protein